MIEIIINGKKVLIKLPVKVEYKGMVYYINEAHKKIGIYITKEN